MPNWAEGSLKLRGKKENIAQALKYMFCTADNVEIEEDLEIGWFELTTTAPCFYINGTRRAFIQNNKLSFWLDDDYLVIEINDFNQAWAVEPENYQEISRVFGWEEYDWANNFRDYARKVEGLLKFKKEIEQLEIIKKALELKSLEELQEKKEHIEAVIKTLEH